MTSPVLVVYGNKIIVSGSYHVNLSYPMF